MPHIILVSLALNILHHNFITSCHLWSTLAMTGATEYTDKFVTLMVGSVQVLQLRNKCYIDYQEFECYSGTTSRAPSITVSFLREPARGRCLGDLPENSENDGPFHPDNAISLCSTRKWNTRGFWRDHRGTPSLVPRCLHHKASAKRFALKCIKERLPCPHLR